MGENIANISKGPCMPETETRSLAVA